jgi:hypothetical protein
MPGFGALRSAAQRTAVDLASPMIIWIKLEAAPTAAMIKNPVT